MPPTVAIRRNDGLLVHVSTDYVFGGIRNNTPCREEEAANPTGVYGETKLHGEEAVIRSGCHYLIIRTAWLYSEYGKNFLKMMLDLTATKPSLKVVFDQTGTPTYAYDLAAAICDTTSRKQSPNMPAIPPATYNPVTATSSPRKSYAPATRYSTRPR